MTTPKAPTQSPSRAGEHGYTTAIFAAVAAVAVFMCVGLAVDGAGRVRAVQRAETVASDAARAGGRSAEASPENADVYAQFAAARNAAHVYLVGASGITGSAEVIDGQLHVTTTTSYEPVFLIFLGTITVHGDATARLGGPT